MINAIWKWGLICGGVMTVFLYAPYFLFFQNGAVDYAMAEVAGYIGMLGALLVIVLAINSHFKNATPDVSIWQRLKLGLGVTLIAGIIFGLTNNVYTFWVNPEFMDSYYAYYISQIPVQDGAAYDQAVADAEAQREMFSSPIMQFLLMGATVWMIGILVSILASIGHWFLTRRKAQKV